MCWKRFKKIKIKIHAWKNIYYTGDPISPFSSLKFQVLFTLVSMVMHVPAIPMDHCSHGDGSAEGGLHFVACRVEIHYVSSIKFQLVHEGSAPSYNSIKKWDRHLKENGSAVNQKLPGCPRTFNKDEEHIRQALLRSPLKLICTARKQLHLSHSTVLDIAHKHLYLHA